MAALLNLARDRLSGGGSAAYKEKSVLDQRVLDGHLGGATSFIVLSRRRSLGKKTSLCSVHPPLT